MPKYGGIGGQGGAVYLKAVEKCSLKELWRKNPSKMIEARSGEDSNKMRLVGRRGADQELEIPCGVTVIDNDTSQIIGELNKEDETCLVASGGNFDIHSLM